MLWKKTFVALLIITLTASIVLLPGCTCNEEEPKDGDNITPVPSQVIEDISISEAFNLIQQNQGNSDFVVLDVRTANEYNSGHIESAIMIDFYTDTFEAELSLLDKDKTYLIYCRSGNRSAQARDIMENLGFSVVYNMQGGFNDWVDEGYATV